MWCLIGLWCGCVGSVKTSANSLNSVSHFVATDNIFPVSCCWSLCESSWGWCEYSVAAVDMLRWLASVEQAASIQIAKDFCCSDGVLSMSYICFVMHNVDECLV